jgi:hypothetical protein
VHGGNLQLAGYQWFVVVFFLFSALQHQKTKKQYMIVDY